MRKRPFLCQMSLRLRMLLLFLASITIIVVLTFQIVRSATYSHSTNLFWTQTQTAAAVVKDRIENRADLLLRATDNLSKNFSIKQAICDAAEDAKSLFVAMENQSKRLNADIFFVLGESQQLLSSSTDLVPPTTTNAFMQDGASWFVHDNKTYLVKGSPVKFVERSPHIDAWVFLGFEIDQIISQGLSKLTDMQVTLFQPNTTSHTILGSSLNPELLNPLKRENIVLSNALQHMQLNDNSYMYTAQKYGTLNQQPGYLLLSAVAEKAYLTYNSLLGQIVGLLFAAALLALFAAMLLSRSVSEPLDRLVLAANRIRNGKYINTLPESSTVEVNALSLAINDMQNGIRKREQQINYLAYYDELTGLPNRNQFTDFLQQSISTENIHFVVLMLDIDRFSEINDTLGHDVGDKLLKAIAKRLSSCNETPAFFARTGGDEFAAIISLDCNMDAGSIAKSIAMKFDVPFQVNGVLLDVDCSIGVSLFPIHGKTTQALVQRANIALYSGKGKHFDYTVYSEKLNKHSVLRLNLMSELKDALSNGELQLHYQPKLCINENRITSVECLVRWTHPKYGFISPDEFVPLAEQTGAIRDVTKWVLRTAIAQQRKWQQQGQSIAVAVNISAIDLIDMQLPVFVGNLLSEFDCDPAMLTMEVTESAIMADHDSAVRALNTLKHMGIRLSIDDFGTGYSSMAQLKTMPVHELKIDKAFVLELAKNEEDRAIVKTIVALAANLNLSTVAEGVEDDETLTFLRKIGCTKAQGFHLNKALPAHEFDLWLGASLKPEKDKLTS